MTKTMQIWKAYEGGMNTTMQVNEDYGRLEEQEV